MADKLTQQITDALARAAAQPGGLPLYSSKASAGLFPNTAAAKSAAQKCLGDELVYAVGKAETAKPRRELYALTEKGWSFLLAAVNPKQVLEDFVRVLEARQGEVGELLDTARSMAESLHGLKEAVSRVLPEISLNRVKESPSRELMVSTPRGSFGGSSQRTGFPDTPVAVLDAPPQVELAPAILSYLADHASPTDCPLPELYRALTERSPVPRIGEFHDCLRTLYAEGALYLHPWTGPLYELPEPQYALLIGHGIAYYASLKG